MTPRNTILTGDVLERLASLPDSGVDTVTTSVPYFLLRDYGVAGQIGLEGTVDAWVEALRPVMAEIARVLKPTGSLWLNVGDTYSHGAKYGAPAKGMFLAPERLLLALAADGWIVRSKVIWAKPNPMPNSVTDRLSSTYDNVYFLVREQHYYFDLDAIRVPHTSTPTATHDSGSSDTRRPSWAGPLAGSNSGLRRARPAGVPGHLRGKNPGDVWRIPTKGYRGAHFATFPERLIETPILATCPEVICTKCEVPWRRTTKIIRVPISGTTSTPLPKDARVRRFATLWHTYRDVGALVPCGCKAPTIPGLVLDPFFGSGTVGVVAERLGRDWLGVELNPGYVDLAWQRLGRGSPGVERAA